MTDEVPPYKLDLDELMQRADVPKLLRRWRSRRAFARKIRPADP